MQSKSGRYRCASTQEKNQRSPSGRLSERVCRKVGDRAAGRRAVEGKSSSVDRREVPGSPTGSQTRHLRIAEDATAARSFNVGHSHASANAHPDAGAQQDGEDVAEQEQGEDVSQPDDARSTQAQHGTLAAAPQGAHGVTEVPILGRLLVRAAAPVPDPVSRYWLPLLLVDDEGDCFIRWTVQALGTAAAACGGHVGVPLCLQQQLLEDVGVAGEGGRGSVRC